MSAKLCNECMHSKPLSEFGKDSNKPDGLRGQCKTCRNERAAMYQERQRQRRREWMDELKSGPCADCGLTFPPVCMDFDHLGDDKTQIVSRLVYGNASNARVLAEVAKCELVCSNCHRIRTFIERKQCGAPRKYDRTGWEAA
jgi:hypothetical protein